jgi:hypothetical protein
LALVAAFKESYPSAVGQAFALSFIQSISHSPRHLRALYWRVTTSQDRHKGIFNSELDMSRTHVEHIVPQTPLLSGDEQHRYTWPQAFFSAGVDGEVTEFIGELIREGDDDALGGLMEAVVIDDYANVCLLRDEVNERIQNSPFDVKVPQYMLTPGFNLATVNSHLTVEYLPDGIESAVVRTGVKKMLDGDLCVPKVDPWIRKVLREEGVGEEAGDATLKAVLDNHAMTDTERQTLRDWWNVESFKRRKVALTRSILDDLRLDSEEFEGVDLSSIIDEDIRKRIKLFMIENGWEG